MGGTTNPYHLGIDLGTTYTAAAVHRGGHTQMATLGNRAAAAPSVLLLRDDGQFLYGEAAEARGESEPHRLAREFKRRLGDPVPLIVDKTPFAADALMAKMLRWVVDTVTRTEGEAPAGVAVTHPANWGDYKRDLLRQALRVNELDHAVLLSEPEAAAIHYATEERLADGATVAVYDLGGGTFDAAVLRRSGSGWELLGNPEGVERLGGIDVDTAVFTHVVQTLGITTDEPESADEDPDDSGRQTALYRLRRDCVAAKELLSEDTDTSISVLLPDIQTQVRLTRAELEAMIRPTLAESTTALSTALRSAQVTASDIDAVLLVGGSSRIPLVGELVSTALGRPVVVNAHPKHSIALGAAAVAANPAGFGAGPDTEPTATSGTDTATMPSGLDAAAAETDVGGIAETAADAPHGSAVTEEQDTPTPTESTTSDATPAPSTEAETTATGTTTEDAPPLISEHPTTADDPPLGSAGSRPTDTPAGYPGTPTDETSAPASTPLPGWGWRLRHSLWLLATLPLGLTTWCGFLYIGIRARRTLWLVAAGLYLVAAIVLVVIIGAAPVDENGETQAGTWQAVVGTALLLLIWLGGMTHGLISNIAWLHWRRDHR